MTILANSVYGSQISDLIYSSEPFVTFDHISNVIDLEFSYPSPEFLKKRVGNALVIPLLSGIEQPLQSDHHQHASRQSDSLALPEIIERTQCRPEGSRWLRFFRSYLRSPVRNRQETVNRRGFIRIGLLINGAVVAIYIHRNGLDNILSFVRQIFIASIVIHFGYLIVRKRPVERPRSMRQSLT